MYEVRTLDESEYEMWDKFSDESEQGTFYTSTAWIRTIARQYGRARITGVFSGREILCGCIFIERKILGYFLEGDHMPFTPYSGVLLKKLHTTKLSKTESVSKEVIASLLHYLNKTYSSVYITNSPYFVDIRDFTRKGWRCDVLYTYRIRTEDLEKIWAGFDGTLRQQIRKAEREDIKIAESNDPGAFYALLKSTYLRQGLGVPPGMDFLMDINKNVLEAGNGILLLAVGKKGEIMAGAIITWDRKQAYYAMGGSNYEFLGSGASSLLQWHIIQMLHHRGLTYDLVGAHTPNVARYKRGFNPELVPFYKVYKINSVLLGIGKRCLLMSRRLRDRWL